MPQYHSLQDYENISGSRYPYNFPVVTSEMNMSNLEQAMQPNLEYWNSAMCDTTADGTHSWECGLECVAMPQSYGYLTESTEGNTSSTAPTSPTTYSNLLATNSSTPRSSDGEDRYQRRRQQNRAAQRAYRDRKSQYVSGLEDSVRELQQKLTILQKENIGLRETINELCIRHRAGY